MSIARETQTETKPAPQQGSDADLGKEQFPPELRELWQRVAEEATRYGGGRGEANQKEAGS